MLSKTYKDDDWASDTDPYDLKPKLTKKRRRPSRKEVLDALEEHNDGYPQDYAQDTMDD